MVDEVGRRQTPKLWPLTSLAGIEIGSPFNESMAMQLGLHRDVKLERELEFEDEQWIGERDSQYFAIDVNGGRVTGVSSHSDLHVHGIQLLGLTPDAVVRAIGEPSKDDIGEGMGTYDYENGSWTFVVGFWEYVATWASLNDYGYFDKEVPLRSV